MTHNIKVDSTGCRWSTHNKGSIGFPDSSIGKKPAEGDICARIFGDNKKPRCILIDPMNNAWTRMIANGYSVGIVTDKPVGYRRDMGRTACTVYQNTRRFINNNKFIMLSNNRYAIVFYRVCI
jgi:hypothetical protein